MTFASDLALRVAGYDRSRERRLAFASRAEERLQLDRELQSDERASRDAMERVGRTPHIVLGTTASGIPYRIPLVDFTSLPSWTTAATGAGKSRFMGHAILSVITEMLDGARVSVVLIDGKGETADSHLRAIAAMAGRLPRSERPAFLSRICTLRFFDRDYLPSWPILARAPGVPIASQADAFAEILNDVVADATVGPRQRSTLAAVVAVSLEFGLPLVALPFLLSSPKEVSELAARSSMPSVRLDLARFDREPQGSIDGIVARLGVILRSPSLKAIVSGTKPFDWSMCFEPGSVTTLDFGGADLGARAGVRAMGSLAISALANAAFDPRRIVKGTTLIVVDEPQTLITSVTLGQFERLVTLGRSFGAGGLVLLHQGATQLPIELQNILNTNVPLRVLGRSSERDASASSEWLPHTGRVPKPREPGARGHESAFLNEGQEERYRIMELGKLPPRFFLVSDRRAPFAPRVVRAPDHNPPPWSAIDPEIADAVRRGSSGVPRRELEERVRRIEEEAAAKLAGQVRAEEAVRRGRRRGGAPPATPDVVGRSTGRGRQGGVL